MIVGLVGLKGHGKDTAGVYFHNLFAYKRMAFAYNLKVAAMQIFRLQPMQVFGDISVKETVDKRWGLTPREILQQLGTEVGRHIHPEVWVKSVMLSIEADGSKKFIITDVRFLNEAKAIKDAGGLVVRVSRPGFGTDEHNDHQSELEVLEIKHDYELVNDSTLDALRDKVKLLGKLIQEEHIAPPAVESAP